MPKNDARKPEQPAARHGMGGTRGNRGGRKRHVFEITPKGMEKAEKMR